MSYQRVTADVRLSRFPHASQSIRISERECPLARRDADNLLHVEQADPAAVIVIFQHMDRDVLEYVVLPVNRKPDLLERLASDVCQQRKQGTRHERSKQRQSVEERENAKTVTQKRIGRQAQRDLN